MTAAHGVPDECPRDPAGHDPSRAGPAGMDPSAREVIENIVRAVREGDDARIRALLATLAAVADTTALLYLREPLYAPDEDVVQARRNRSPAFTGRRTPQARPGRRGTPRPSASHCRSTAS